MKRRLLLAFTLLWVARSFRVEGDPDSLDVDEDHHSVEPQAQLRKSQDLMARVAKQEHQMPFCLVFFSTISKLLVLLLALGPEAVRKEEPTSGWGRFKANAKVAFQWFLLILFLAVVVMDVVGLWKVFRLCRDNGISWLCTFAAVVIRMSMSSNAQTAFAMNGLAVTYDHHLSFAQCHKSSKQYVPEPGAMQQLMITQKGWPAWILYQLGMCFYMLNMTLLVPAVVVLISLLLGWVPFVIFGSASVLAKAFHWCAMKRSDKATYEALPFNKYEDGEYENMRNLYRHMVRGAQNSHVLAGINLQKDATLQSKYRRDLATYKELGSTEAGILNFAGWQLGGPLAFATAALMASRMLAWLQFGEHSWGAFRTEYWQAVFTFGERHWWSYRDYILSCKDDVISTWGRTPAIAAKLIDVVSRVI
ncbi:unnamed protein product [Symbiodinium pilosum]|uniref:ABC transmembrane type-1 domain-containing protein n=1 Tax=Symbiodinium pilosum TaxID=2952 RepID=A0A812J0G2_SYMPI|nr:unnamed protein product [Symbiodinium pilosum]